LKNCIKFHFLITRKSGKFHLNASLHLFCSKNDIKSRRFSPGPDIGIPVTSPSRDPIFMAIFFTNFFTPIFVHTNIFAFYTPNILFFTPIFLTKTFCFFTPHFDI